VDSGGTLYTFSKVYPTTPQPWWQASHATSQARTVDVVGKICLEDVQQSAAADVICAHSHPGLLPSIFVESKTGTNADLFEGFSAQVVIIQTRCGIAGDINVDWIRVKTRFETR
jgi:hypothetical protein